MSANLRGLAVSEGVWCLRADNPSPMTGSGTNSYLIDSSAGLVLIDPGPALPHHLERLLAAIGDLARLKAILVTHAHLDHSALVPALTAITMAPVFAFGDALSGQRAMPYPGLESGGEGVDHGFHPSHLLSDGEDFSFGDRSFRALHTPGHMGGHLCFAMGDVLFTGDHVMGWSSTLISPPDGHMGDYMSSLERLARQNWSLALAGHGEPIDAPAARISELLAHRRKRENAILTALDHTPMNAKSLASLLYTETPSPLMPAAIRSVMSHLIDLTEKSLVTPISDFSTSAIFIRT